MRIEIAKLYNPVADWALGVAGVVVTNRRLRQVIYEGSENILKINESLKWGSVLLVADHFGNDNTENRETLYSAGFALRLRNRKISAIFMREFQPNEMRRGRILLATLARHKVEPLMVKTPKYEPDDNTRAEYNPPSTRRGTKILGKPGGLVLIYASGTRNPTMLEAENGSTFLPAFADWVVPMRLPLSKMEPNQKW